MIGTRSRSWKKSSVISILAIMWRLKRSRDLKILLIEHR